MSERGRCAACRMRVRLRKDGTVQKHWIWGYDRHVCCGSYSKPMTLGEAAR